MQVNVSLEFRPLTTRDNGPIDPLSGDSSAALQAAWRAGDLTKVARIRDSLTPLNAALFAEINPVPIKFAVSLLGYCDPSVRLPLVEASRETRVLVESAMRFAGLLS